jgi:hypothetical protein
LIFATTGRVWTFRARGRRPSSRSPDHDIVEGCECGREP